LINFTNVAFHLRWWNFLWPLPLQVLASSIPSAWPFYSVNMFTEFES